MNGMTLDEVLQKKLELEKILFDALRDFESATELTVSGVQIDRVSVFGVEHRYIVNVATEVIL